MVVHRWFVQVVDSNVVRGGILVGKRAEAAGYVKLRQKLQRLEQSGQLYRWLIDRQVMKPVSFALTRYCQQVAQEGGLAGLRQWVDFWRKGTRGTVEEARKDVLPKVRTMVPVRIVFADARAVFAELGESGRAEAFLSMHRRILQELPAAIPWLLDYPRRIQEKDFFPGCLALGKAFLAGIEPGQYLREIQAEGVDTKFMERDVLLTRSLWNTLNPAQSAANEAELRELWQTRQVESPSVGVRVLDERLGWYGVTQFFLSTEEAARCCLPVQRVFITENKVNGYRLPLMTGSMVLFGMGYGVIELARKAAWLRQTEVIYWGDLDSNGFDILSRLRAVLPTVRSLLMTPDLWARYPEAVVTDEGACQRIPDRLTVREKRAWAIGRENQARLEQERIPLRDVETAVDDICADG